jgi:hypothetical protein
MERLPSTVGYAALPALYAYCLTVFFDGDESMTFAFLVPAGGGEPDERTVMGTPTEKFYPDKGVVRRRNRAKRTALH